MWVTVCDICFTEGMHTYVCLLVLNRNSACIHTLIIWLGEGRHSVLSFCATAAVVGGDVYCCASGTGFYRTSILSRPVGICLNLCPDPLPGYCPT